MSYSQEVKKEVMENTNLTKLEMLGEIRSIILSKNCIYSDRIEIKLDNITLASRIYGLLQESTDFKILIKYSISKKFGEHKVYFVTIPRQRGLKEFISKINNITNSIIIANEELLKGTMRGYLLYSGYIKNPLKEYAMDFFIDSEVAAELLHQLLIAYDKKAFKTVKKSKFLVYLRNSEDILDIYILVGSQKAFFKFEETTMIKSLRNRTNREMNYEIANETKTLDSANRQVKMIRYIDDEFGLENLSEVLKEVAELRLRYVESSLQEIADMVGLTKSGIKNRFRRIEEFYKKLKEERTN